jgi:cytochrome c oxidase cbb3-type subunit 3
MRRTALATTFALLALPLSAQEPPKRSALWGAYCTACHGEDGRSQTEEGLKKRARNLADPRWQETVADSRLESSIRRGRDRMPAFGKKLSDEQTKALVAEIRSLARKGP